MKIIEYDQVDPLGVLHLNLLSLGYALTPEKVALIRRLDPTVRPYKIVQLTTVGKAFKPPQAW